MTAISREQEFAEEFAAFVITERLFGANSKQAAASAVASFFRDGKPLYGKSKRRLSWSQWAPIRDRVFERDGYQCVYCGDEDGPLEIDHITPVTRGGTDDLENLCVACRVCNISKSNRLLSDWTLSRGATP